MEESIVVFIGKAVFFISCGYLIGYFVRGIGTKPKVKGRVIKKGDKAWVRLNWSDERGEMVKHRHYIFHDIAPYYGGDGKMQDKHFVQLVGDETSDYPTQQNFGLIPKDEEKDDGMGDTE